MRSGIAKGAINAAWDAIGEVIKAWATEGHSVAVPGLGTMRFGLRSKSIADVNKVGSDLITMRRVIFTPNVDIKDELKKTSINITCYDRNGELVKRVTSSDDGNIEDNDGGDDTPGGGGDTPSGGGSGNGSTDSGNNGGSNSGSGTVTPTVNAPNFSGATQFEESTQVTMTGPTGASIFYTLDGSTPTDQSLEYEGPSRDGHLFRERFKSEPVNDMAYFVTLLRYIHQNPVKAGMVSEVKDYEFSSWHEFEDKNSTLFPLCDTHTVLNRIPFDDLNELVNEPLSDEVACLDIEDASKGRPSDDQVMMLIKEKTGATNSTAFQQLPADMKKSILVELKSRKASLRQLERLTGIGKSMIYRM